MPFTLSTFSNQDLFFILDCKNFKELITKYGKMPVKQFIEEASRLIQIEINKHKISQSLMTFSDGPNYPMLALWGILEVITLDLIPLTILSGFIFILVLGLSGLYFHSTYQELKKEAEKTKRFFILANLKQQCADELIARLSIEIEKKLINNNVQTEWRVKPVPEPANIQNKIEKNNLPRLRKAISTTMLISTTLVGTYYFGTSTIITAYGLTTLASAMLGPVGLAAAFIFSFALGTYFGYKYYQACKNDEIIKEQQKQINNTNEIKRQQCYELKTKLEQTKLAHKNTLINKNHPIDKKSKAPLRSKTTTAPNVNSTYRLSYFPMLLVNRAHRIKKPNMTNVLHKKHRQFMR